MQVKDAIIKALKEEGRPLSTYEIAKKIGSSWETASRHLHMLALEGTVKKIKEQKGFRERILWELTEVIE